MKQKASKQKYTENARIYNWKEDNWAYLISSNAFGAEYFRFEPWEIVNADAVLFPWNGDEDILAFEHLHLLESSPRYQLIDFTLSTSIE